MDVELKYGAKKIYGDIAEALFNSASFYGIVCEKFFISGNMYGKSKVEISLKYVSAVFTFEDVEPVKLLGFLAQLAKSRPITTYNKEYFLKNAKSFMADLEEAFRKNGN